MGYRSDIAIAYVFKHKEQVDEVLAIYQMNQNVQKHDLAKEWQVHDWGGKWGLTYTAEHVKWYDDYEDVQGFEHMFDVVQRFVEERDVFLYSYRKIRVGEEDQDIEVASDNNGPDYELADELYERMGVQRELTTNF